MLLLIFIKMKPKDIKVEEHLPHPTWFYLWQQRKPPPHTHTHAQNYIDITILMQTCTT